MTETTITKHERKLSLLLKRDNSSQFETVRNEISREIFDSSAFTLKEKGYVDAIFDLQKHCIIVTLNQKGNAYIHENPKARNSFFTENTRWVIGIGVTIIIFVLGLIFK